MRSWMSRATGSALLGCAMLAGCHHANRCPSCGGRLRAEAAPAQTTAVAAAPAAAPSPVSPYAGLAPVSGPVVHQTLKPVPDPEPTARKDPNEWQKLSGKVREQLNERRTFTDLTVNPAFAHAPDMSWLVGELREIGPGVWCVRFASVDDERDTVTLVDAPPMVNLRSGQVVRVEGQLADPSSRDVKPAYRVTAIRPVEKD